MLLVKLESLVDDTLWVVRYNQDLSKVVHHMMHMNIKKK